MAPAAWLLLGVVAQAWPHWQWSVLWTPLTPDRGGLRDQILGTLILMAGVLLMAGTSASWPASTCPSSPARAS